MMARKHTHTVARLVRHRRIQDQTPTSLARLRIMVLVVPHQVSRQFDKIVDLYNTPSIRVFVLNTRLPESRIYKCIWWSFNFLFQEAQEVSVYVLCIHPQCPSSFPNHSFRVTMPDSQRRHAYGVKKLQSRSITSAAAHAHKWRSRLVQQCSRSLTGMSPSRIVSVITLTTVSRMWIEKRSISASSYRAVQSLLAGYKESVSNGPSCLQNHL